jgi:Delta endotoxin
VKYVVVPREEKDHLPKVGDILTNGIEYKENDEFILWAGHEVFVYLVDNHNKIIDMIDANETWHAWPFEFTADENKKEITMKTTVKVGDMSPVNDSLKYLYLFNDGVMVKMTDFGNLKWEYIDGIPTVKIPYSDTEFTSTKPNRILCSLDMERSVRGHLGSIVNNLSEPYNVDKDKSLMAFVIKSLVNEDEETFIWVLSHLGDKNNGVDIKFDSLSIATYKEEIQKNKEATFQDLQNIIKQVNEKLKDQIEKFEAANEAVSNLFKENRYEYSYGDKNVLKEGITMDQIKQAEALVKEVSDRFKEKEHLLNDIAYAKYLLNMPALQENMRKEITVSADKKIQDSLNSLIFPQGIPEGIKIKVQGIGKEKVEDKDQGISYVTGGSKYLGVNENGELILNRINSTGNAVTEYVQINFYREDNSYISQAIIAVTIEPSTEYLEGSAETNIINLEEGQSKIIRYIYNEDRRVEIQPGTTVSAFLSKIKAEDGSSQTYQVKAEDGTVKGNEDIIQHHDRLIVTAENGKSIAVYDIIVPIIIENIQQGTLGEFIITVNNVSIEDLKNTLRVGDPLKEGGWHLITPTITEAQDDEGNIILNQYKVSIPYPKYNVKYKISNLERPVRSKDYNMNMEIVWPSSEE